MLLIERYLEPRFGARVTRGADTGHDCTNYAACVETLNGAARPTYQFGDVRQLTLSGTVWRVRRRPTVSD
jgi:hypothetical protein